MPLSATDMMHTSLTFHILRCRADYSPYIGIIWIYKDAIGGCLPSLFYNELLLTRQSALALNYNASK